MSTKSNIFFDKSKLFNVVGRLSGVLRRPRLAQSAELSGLEQEHTIGGQEANEEALATMEAKTTLIKILTHMLIV